MLFSLKDGGTTLYDNGNIYFQEFTQKPTVLNGWIFSVFGLFDFFKISKDPHINEILNLSLCTIKENLPKFDANYWSNYNIDKSIIASPFYHNLHIAQLEVMYDLFKNEIFKFYSEKWKTYKRKPHYCFCAFLVKVIQKLINKK